MDNSELQAMASDTFNKEQLALYCEQTTLWFNMSENAISQGRQGTLAQQYFYYSAKAAGFMASYYDQYVHPSMFNKVSLNDPKLAEYTSKRDSYLKEWLAELDQKLARATMLAVLITTEGRES